MVDLRGGTQVAMGGMASPANGNKKRLRRLGPSGCGQPKENYWPCLDQ